ncbi:MAG: hypothetical protein Q9166_007953, partial [cf. Caloplaca sp. 2 TL-2023]
MNGQSQPIFIVYSGVDGKYQNIQRIYCHKDQAISWCQRQINANLEPSKTYLGGPKEKHVKEGVVEVIRDPQGDSTGYTVVDSEFWRYKPSRPKAVVAGKIDEFLYVLCDPELKVLWATEDWDETRFLRQKPGFPILSVP